MAAQVLGQGVEELRIVGHVRELSFRGDRIGDDIVSGDHEPSARRRNDAGQGAQRRRLAGAVRPEQPDDLPRPDAKRQPGDGDGLLIDLMEIEDVDHGASAYPNERWRRNTARDRTKSCGSSRAVESSEATSGAGWADS